MIARAGCEVHSAPAPSAVPLLSLVCRRCGPSSGRHFQFCDGQVSVCHWVDGGVCLHVLILLIVFAWRVRPEERGWGQGCAILELDLLELAS